MNTCKLDTARIYDELQEQRENNGKDVNSNNRQESEDLNENTTDNNNEATNYLAPEDLSCVNEITQVAKEIYEDIVTEMGNMKKRDVSTFVKKTYPKRNADLEHLQYVAKSLTLTNPSIEPERFLWEYNCAIYSVVKAWKVIHDKGSEESKPKTGTKPCWMASGKMPNKWCQQT